MATSDHTGPALTRVTPDDDEALRALFAEQRARLAVVRENRIWQWFGGMPSGFGSPSAPVLDIYLAIAAVCCFAVALIVAGFTWGLWLWITAGLGVAVLIWRAVVTIPPRRKTRALFDRAETWPGVVVAHGHSSKNDALAVFALVHPRIDGADTLQRLVECGDRLRALVGGGDGAPAELQAIAATVRERMSSPVPDGSRAPVPASIGMKGCELAFVEVWPQLLPSGQLDSRLLFVFADPEHRDAAHTRVLQGTVWGGACEFLCDALPLEARA